MKTYEVSKIQNCGDIIDKELCIRQIKKKKTFNSNKKSTYTLRKEHGAWSMSAMGRNNKEVSMAGAY